MESHIRSIAKAVSWRLGGTAVTFLTAWFFIGTLDTAVKIGILDTILKIGVFYIHERFWNRLNFGKSAPPEYQI
jgi:uncharacterized membrane protein